MTPETAPEGWAPATLRIACRLGPEIVQGWTNPDVPGLSITPDINCDGWNVTHVGSGIRLGQTCFASVLDACKMASALGITVDWTQDVAAFATPENVELGRRAYFAALDCLGYPRNGTHISTAAMAAKWLETANVATGGATR